MAELEAQKVCEHQNADYLRMMRERDAALSTIAKVRAAVSGHPKCDQYEDDGPITCGWKNAYASVVRALEDSSEVKS